MYSLWQTVTEQTLLENYQIVEQIFTQSSIYSHLFTPLSFVTFMKNESSVVICAYLWLSPPEQTLSH